MARPILTGRLSHVAIASYLAPAGALRTLLPGGLADEVEIDAPHPHLSAPVGSDLGVVSLVGQTLSELRVMGVGIPTQRTGADLSLQVHVRQGDRRGVVVVKRFVSRPLLAMVARKRLGEIAEVQRLKPEIAHGPRTLRVSYELQFQPRMVVPGPGQVARPDGSPGTYRLSLEGTKPSVRADAESLSHALKETRWVFSPGVAAQRGGGPGGANGAATTAGSTGGVMIHECLHPVWSIHPVTGVQVEMDFGNLFGVDWGFLSGQTPGAGVLAVGSEVAIFGRRPTVQVLWGQRRQTHKSSG
ncbi:MAG TPA: DUF2071 domain-containing protein [Phycisphaerales bacterium]|nr:DUF2071 domain-containing protein [Phycisphaerales bacterium]